MLSNAKQTRGSFRGFVVQEYAVHAQITFSTSRPHQHVVQTARRSENRERKY